MSSGFIPESRQEPARDYGDHRGGGPSMDDSVIYNVAQMFGTELPILNESQKKDGKKRKQEEDFPGVDDDFDND